MTDAGATLRVEIIPAGHEISEGPEVTVLGLAGELDLATISILRDAVEPHLTGGGRIILDLTALEFCDSTGLGTFVGLHRQAARTGARLCLAAPVPRVRDLLDLSGIDQVIPVYPDRSAATDG